MMTIAEMVAQYWLYGLAVVGSVLFALASRDRHIIGASLLFAAGWWLYVLHWTPYGIAWEIDTDPETAWAMVDALIACSIMAYAGEKWWGRMLWATYTVQCCGHVVSQMAGDMGGAYFYLLDGVFIVQLAVFFTLGGGSVRDRIIDLFGGISGFRHLRPSHKESAQSGLNRAGR
jgi:hypothetical protein